MKIRQGYVSNSSSSSFIIAYDESFFGDLREFCNNYSLGCETIVCFDKAEIEEKYNDYFSDETERNNFKAMVHEQETQGKKIAYLCLDNEYYPLMALMMQINNANSGDKLTMLFDNSED